jgi:hypothetical protein
VVAVDGDHEDEQLGKLLLELRVTSMPKMPGRQMSMRTTSGRRAPSNRTVPPGGRDPQIAIG